MAEDQKRALRVPCPTCGAAIDEPCHAAAHPNKPVAAHIARLDAAAPLALDDEQLHYAALDANIAAEHPKRSAKKRIWLFALRDVYRDELRRRHQVATGQDGDA